MVHGEKSLKIAGDFFAALNMLSGKMCWSVIAGKWTGSVLSINIGKKILLRQPVNNMGLSEDERKYEGEYILHIMCSWRLDSHESVICSWSEAGMGNGAMLRGINSLVNDRVMHVDVHRPAMDLMIHFESEMSLKVFCDCTSLSEKDKGDNYFLNTPDDIYIVGAGSLLSREERNMPQGKESPIEG